MPQHETKYPKIGLETALDHLHDVLDPAYVQWTRRQTRANALAIAQAAWQLCDRYWHDKGCPDKQPFMDALYNACPELRLMRDHAETGKHTGLGRADVQLVSITGAENPGGISETATPIGTHTAVPECTLTMHAGDKDYDLSDLLKRVVGFWHKELTPPA